jgi:hypothetical protein
MLSCDQCGYQTKSKSNLINPHKALYLDKQLKCNKCSFQTNKQTLTEHNQAKHEGIRFPYISSLLIHKRSIHEKYPCGSCDSQATANASLIIHNQSLHKDITFPCESCAYQKKNQSRRI